MSIPIDQIIETVLSEYPETQAIYLFGSYGTEDEWPSSDVDIALLLPHDRAKEIASLAMSPLQTKLESLLHKDVDLINAREVSTIFKKEIITANRRIFSTDDTAAIEFEIVVIRMYQDLRIERAGIIKHALETGRFIQ